MVAVRSFTRGAQIAPKKLRIILNEVRDKRVDEALSILRFMPTPHARTVAKVVRSAVANAESNYNLDPRGLRIVAAHAGDGLRLKRFIPRARGRADIKWRRRANITVVVDEREER